MAMVHQGKLGASPADFGCCVALAPVGLDGETETDGPRGEGGGAIVRGPQSLQSEPNGQSAPAEPGPPSWHSPFAVLLRKGASKSGEVQVSSHSSGGNGGGGARGGGGGRLGGSDGGG